MNLFSNENNSTVNLLPKDGVVNYFGKLFTDEVASYYLQCLMHAIEWRNDEAIIFGKHIVTKRKVALYGDTNFNYTYSKITKQALIWSDELFEIKTMVEQQTGEQFNACLLNLYHTGEEGMAWHSDAEKELKKDGAIASISFGAERKFAFKHKQDKQTISLLLEHGSLLLMKGNTQSNWLHSLPPTKRINTPRINLTFRTMVL